MPANPEQILAAQIASLAWRALAESGLTMEELADRMGVPAKTPSLAEAFEGRCKHISTAAILLTTLGYQINAELRRTEVAVSGENFYEKEADQ